MDVTERLVGHWLVLHGRLDFHSAPDVRQGLHRAIDGGSGELVVEVGGLVLVDAAALGLFLEAHRRADRAGRRLVLSGVSPALERLLRVTRLDRVLHQVVEHDAVRGATA